MGDAGQSIEELQAEIASLRQQVGALQRSERALQHQAWMYVWAHRATSLGIWSWDVAANVVTWSDEAHRLFGIDPGKGLLTYASYLSLIHPADLDRVKAQVAAAVEQNKPLRYECRITRPDGVGRIIRIQADLAAESPGSPSYLIGTAQDITERALADADLQIFRALADNAPDGVLVFNADCVVTYANAAYQTLLGYEDEVIGMSWFTHYDQTPAQLRELIERTQSQGSWRGVLTHRRKQGDLFKGQVSMMVIRHDLEQTIRIACIVRDLSTEQRAEQERLALQEQVIAAQRAALVEMSTPLIPLADGIVAMPLIGSIDSTRAQQVLTTLLDGVAALRAETVILDITGVSQADARVASMLLQAARAVTLLGARIILTGISAMVAQTLVSTGLDLTGVTTYSTIQSGIRYALGQRQSRPMR